MIFGLPPNFGEILWRTNGKFWIIHSAAKYYYVGLARSNDNAVISVKTSGWSDDEDDDDVLQTGLIFAVFLISLHLQLYVKKDSHWFMEVSNEDLINDGDQFTDNVLDIENGTVRMVKFSRWNLAQFLFVCFVSWRRRLDVGCIRQGLCRTRSLCAAITGWIWCGGGLGGFAGRTRTLTRLVRGQSFCRC